MLQRDDSTISGLAVIRWSYDRDPRMNRTTPMVRLLVRNLCMVFDRYLRPDVSGFSSTP